MQEFEAMSQEHRRKEREVVVEMEARYSAKYGSPPDLSGYAAESYGGNSVMNNQRGRQQTQMQVEMDSQQLDDGEQPTIVWSCVVS